MYKIALICVWIGDFPSYFRVWLNSCENNPSIDFLVFADKETNYTIPENVRIIKKTFEEIKQLIQSKFDFCVSLERSYKLCDYKPTFGEVFSDYLVEYDFWGHCDIDLFWGKIRDYISDEILEKNDVILSHGPLTIYRNCERVNSYYRTLPCGNHIDWRVVYSTDKSWAFDEWSEDKGGGMSVICRENNISVYDDEKFGPKYYLRSKKMYFWTWLDKKIYVEYKDGIVQYKQKNRVIKELPYCHFIGCKSYIKYHGDIQKDFYFVWPGIFTDKKKLFFCQRISYSICLLFTTLKKKVVNKIKYIRETRIKAV